MFELNFEKEYIHDLICVYRKLLPDHEYLIRAIHNSEQIHKGKYIYDKCWDTEENAIRARNQIIIDLHLEEYFIIQ